MSQGLCILALLCFAVCVVENTESEPGFKDLQLRQGSLSWLNKLQNKLESTKILSLIDLLHTVFKSENGIVLREPKQEKNRRGLGSGNTTHAQRRPGCRVFFWKSWTAC
ncbi:somatostatin-1-like [Mastacembelus armatus]|uniref:Somatostatin-1-like n=1 Tax=Mastacembelus armatus TaxID=205130 RepID=A0A3Q3M3G9_9TELE|nr:somatostatin-1-like [Mastacembelus armatus]